MPFTPENYVEVVAYYQAMLERLLAVPVDFEDDAQWYFTRESGLGMLRAFRDLERN